jgi:hypothetical protein
VLCGVGEGERVEEERREKKKREKYRSYITTKDTHTAHINNCVGERSQNG